MLRRALLSTVILTACAPVVAPTEPAARDASADEAVEARAEIVAPPTIANVPAAVPAVKDPSCEGIDTCQGESCCTRLLVPAGDYTDARAGQVHVEAFYLDKYELTVGRVERWVAAGRPTPAADAPIGHDAAGRPMRWKDGWRVQDEDDLRGWERYDTYRVGRDDLPKNFIDWYTAAAVCSFAGGRLPNDAEWRYAAVGGEESRPYPWGTDAQTPDRAVYNCMGDGNQSCSLADILPVGSRPLGAGRWGQRDLAGSMFEWTLDAGGTDETVNRGGGFCYIGGLDRRRASVKVVDNVRRDAPATTSHMVGARCAFDAGEERGVVAQR
ncbi:MAG: SUMF1/EgtB/PvdO family nonheme iron enzyme [Polyangiaceae bacterium]|nr:SUMF1/EgtB/PvdO family nonheme iron enzyme [Polyangiaceae bacterium]